MTLVAVEVNEARIWSTLNGGEWWRWFLARYRSTSRVRVLLASLGGDLYRVEMENRDEASMWIENAVEHGVPRSALKVSCSTESE